MHLQNTILENHHYTIPPGCFTDSPNVAEQPLNELVILTHSIGSSETKMSNLFNHRSSR
jgi:hypothetical protein